MTQEDFEQLRQAAEGLTRLGLISRTVADRKRIGVFSPIREGERRIFPGATGLPRRRWDLNQPGRRRFDLLVASNVFMYASDPERWFRHVFASCKYFLLLDLVGRRRGPDSEFGADGDCMRYRIGDACPRVEGFFDLNTFGDRLLGFRTFTGGANPFDEAPLHFMAVFRGDLADPLLRIDDYPTGIRPILPDLTPLHDVLRKVEARGLQYHLGIVPALLNREMLGFLNSLEYMVPAAHGYDHAYPKYAPLLEAAGDPYNQRTVGVFNEFKGQPYARILSRLSEGRKILEDELGRAVEGYIPPCNKAGRRTARALMEAGYRYYLSDKRIPGCRLPWFRTDFCGRSAGYDFTKQPDIVTLHATWEWDLVRQGETGALDRLLDHLAERKRAERERGRQIGDLLTRG